MKIALCYESMVPAHGGCETYIADLARRLADDGHKVHLIARTFDRSSFPASCHYHPVPPFRGPRWLRPWRFARVCQSILAEHDFDASVGFVKTWGQDVLMPQGGLHVASAAHNRLKYASRWMQKVVRFAQAISVKNWSYRLLERKQFVEHDSIIVVPSRMVRQHLHDYYGITGERVHVVHNAIDTKRFHGHDRLLIRSQLRESIGLAASDSVGLFVGHNYRLKGMDPLLRAVRLIPKGTNFNLIVCGSADFTRYERLAKRWNILDRIRFLGYVADVREAFFAADFLIHPTFYDPCALVTMEALACGLPVITTHFNGASELLPPSLASLTIENPHHHQVMADRIVQLCQPSKRAELARVARETARHWTFEEHYQALLQVFEEAWQRKQPAKSLASQRPGLVS
jgi:UDP-glucose:(heptosyl)LPS alpha-1,3-glucosyltransferase